MLSHVRPDATVDCENPSPVLQSLVECLRALVERRQPGAPLPTLILNGDVLELALATDNVAAMVFDRFIDLAFAADPIFDPTVLYLPGNHDHHIWETAREQLYAEYVRSTPPASDLEAPWHVTRMFADGQGHAAQAELLTALMRRRAGPGVEVRIVYPNLGLSSPDGSRRVVVHHGHFTEAMYRLISRVRAQLFPKQPLGPDVWDWEADNFAWIDFFWSTLGRSGTAGRDVGLIYDMLQDKRAVKVLAGELGALVGDVGPKPLRPVFKQIGRGALRFGAARASRLERQNPSAVLSDAGRTGLIEYLAGPVNRQLHRERAVTGDTSFVFGHTHKPFEAVYPVQGFEAPLSVFNSGGWVVDTATPRATHGASVIVIDDTCQVSALRMFNQSANAADYRVRPAANPTGVPSSLDDWLGREFDFTCAPWSRFSEVTAQEVARRGQLLPEIIDRGLRYTADG